MIRYGNSLSWINGLVLVLGIALSFQAAAKEEKRLTLSLEKAGIGELVRWAAPYLEKNIVMHPDIRGEVTVVSGEPFAPQDVYRILASILEVYGFVLHDSGDVLKVLPASRATQTSFPVSSGEAASSAEDIVVELIRLRNVSATQVLTVLQPLMSREAHLSAYAESNLLILSDRIHSIARLKEIIHQIDQAGLVDIEVIQLNYAEAPVLLQSIQPALPPSVSARNESRSGLNISADPRTNSLLITGDPVLREPVRQLIQRLDQPLPSQVVTRVVRLSFAAAEAMVPILRSVKGSVAGSARDLSYSEEDVQIEVERSSNALVITAPRALLNSMREVIADLDQRRSQVLVEAVIVEISDEVAQNLGIEWRTSVPEAGSFSGISLLPGGLDTSSPPSVAAGLTLGFFREGDLRGLVRALQSDSRSNILSTPTIVALDNEEASILVGSSVPFITGQSTGPAASVENPFQTIQRQDIGVTLKVLPRINNADSITLKIDQTTESLTTSTVQTADVVTNKREISTTVLIENTQILVLGGLIRDEIEEVQSKVPLLGDIPGIGKLFRSTRTRSVKRNLMAFIRPVILHNPESRYQATRDAYRRVQQSQDHFNARSEHFFVPRALPELRDALPLNTPTGTD